MCIGFHWWGVASDSYDESWAVWLCFAAVVGIGNDGGHAVCGGCCRRLRGCMKVFFGGRTVADHPDKNRSAGSDTGRLRFLLVLAVRRWML